MLHSENEKHIERRDDDADFQRNLEQKIEADGSADHFGEVGRADGDFREQPKRPRHRAGKRVAAGLREIAPGGDAETRAQRLQEDRHHVREERNNQQRVAELGAAGERGRPIAGIHVADRHQIARAEKRQELLPQRPAWPRGDGAKDFGQRRRAAAATPARFGVIRSG
jgi:hypothetical protein